MIILSQKKNELINFGEHDVMEVEVYKYTPSDASKESYSEWRFEVLLTGWEDFKTLGTYKSQENAKSVWESILKALENGDRIFKMPIEKD